VDVAEEAAVSTDREVGRTETKEDREDTAEAGADRDERATDRDAVETDRRDVAKDRAAHGADRSAVGTDRREGATDRCSHRTDASVLAKEVAEHETDRREVATDRSLGHADRSEVATGPSAERTDRADVATDLVAVPMARSRRARDRSPARADRVEDTTDRSAARERPELAPTSVRGPTRGARVVDEVAGEALPSPGEKKEDQLSSSSLIKGRGRDCHRTGQGDRFDGDDGFGGATGWIRSRLRATTSPLGARPDDVLPATLTGSIVEPARLTGFAPATLTGIATSERLPARLTGFEPARLTGSVTLYTVIANSEVDPYTSVLVVPPPREG